MKQAVYFKYGGNQEPVIATVEVVKVISEHKHARGVHPGHKRVMAVIKTQRGMRTHHVDIPR